MLLDCRDGQAQTIRYLTNRQLFEFPHLQAFAALGRKGRHGRPDRPQPFVGRYGLKGVGLVVLDRQQRLVPTAVERRQPSLT